MDSMTYIELEYFAVQTWDFGGKKSGGILKFIQKFLSRPKPKRCFLSLGKLFKTPSLSCTRAYLARVLCRVSVQGVESLWGDCRFIPADWGS